MIQCLFIVIREVNILNMLFLKFGSQAVCIFLTPHHITRYLYVTGQANRGPGASGDVRAGASNESTQQLELPHFQSGGEDPQ